jgi:hypothetical protein
MLQRIENGRASIADAMIKNFRKDQGLKETLRHLDCAVDSIKQNKDHEAELALLRIARLAVREKILLLAYE